LSISGFGIGGTVLAPRASLSHSNNAIDGQVIVNSLSSTGSYRCGGVFQGSVPAQ
jgi:choice-of-anchor A domain-containing protein